ncbi:hypothetical protein DFH06DRAFT_223942 [Mycena polygramma]|nr:hypothetical protein DFH06DRAFT_223942 [Mycena polygramma]
MLAPPLSCTCALFPWPLQLSLSASSAVFPLGCARSATPGPNPGRASYKLNLGRLLSLSPPHFQSPIRADSQLNSMPASSSSLYQFCLWLRIGVSAPMLSSRIANLFPSPHVGNPSASQTFVTGFSRSPRMFFEYSPCVPGQLFEIASPLSCDASIQCLDLHSSSPLRQKTGRRLRRH